MKDLEIKELYKVLEEQWGDSDNYINDLIRYSKELQEELETLEKKYKKIEEIDNMINHENLFLKIRINKAIEYIEELQELKAKDYLKLIEPQYIDRLLDILKGSDKE